MGVLEAHRSIMSRSWGPFATHESLMIQLVHHDEALTRQLVGVSRAMTIGRLRNSLAHERPMASLPAHRLVMSHSWVHP